jgi:hypothetical protein
VTGEKRGDRTVFETPVFANAYRAFAAE